MSTETKKVTSNETIYRAIAAINGGNTAHFYKAIEEYMESLPSGGDIRYRLKGVMRQRPMSFQTLHELPHNVRNLLIQVAVKPEVVFMKLATERMTSELLTEWEHSETLCYHNLPPRNKILLHGATGNGKTTLARHIGSLLPVPYYEVNSDLIIGSHLGGTQKKIGEVFKALEHPCVVFWDEFDTIGCKRGSGDNSAGHENDRMTNSFLINIERLHPNAVFIAATNRFVSLDPAIIRRFDVKHQMDSPSGNEMDAYVQQLLDYYKTPDLSIDLTGCCSFGDAAGVVRDAARRFVVSNATFNLAQ